LDIVEQSVPAVDAWQIQLLRMGRRMEKLGG